jgi:hypothetical protein
MRMVQGILRNGWVKIWIYRDGFAIARLVMRQADTTVERTQ